MKRQKYSPHLRTTLGGLLLAMLSLGATSQAGEELFTNSGFDTAAPGWYWQLAMNSGGSFMMPSSDWP